MIKLYGAAASLCLCCVLAVGAQAQSGQSNTFDVLRLQTVRQNIEAGGHYAGWQLEASKVLASQVFATAYYRDLNDEASTTASLVGNDVVGELKRSEYGGALGLFAKVGRMDNTFVATEFGYRRASLSVAVLQGAVGENAAYAGVSLRNRSYAQVELRADVQYVKWQNSESGYAGLLGLSYLITQNIAFELGFMRQGNTQQYSAGLGWFF